MHFFFFAKKPIMTIAKIFFQGDIGKLPASVVIIDSELGLKSESSESVNLLEKSDLCDTVLDSSVDFPTLCTLTYNAGCGW